jgi:hypothetical protein
MQIIIYCKSSRRTGGMQMNDKANGNNTIDTILTDAEVVFAQRGPLVTADWGIEQGEVCLVGIGHEAFVSNNGELYARIPASLEFEENGMPCYLTEVTYQKGDQSIRELVRAVPAAYTKAATESAIYERFVDEEDRAEAADAINSYIASGKTEAVTAAELGLTNHQMFFVKNWEVIVAAYKVAEKAYNKRQLGSMATLVKQQSELDTTKPN